VLWRDLDCAPHPGQKVGCRLFTVTVHARSRRSTPTTFKPAPGDHVIDVFIAPCCRISSQGASRPASSGASHPASLAPRVNQTRPKWLLTKTQRLYREEGLTVRKRKGRKRATGMRTPILVEARPNARWSVDFVHDQLSNGRRFRILNVIDDVTKECLAAIADTSISGRRVARELDAIIARRGKPDLIISDHGTEFTSNAMLAWAQSSRTAWHFIAPGKPMQNGICEAFNGRMRDELLGLRQQAHQFVT
jgi:transposase InsO family protein